MSRHVVIKEMCLDYMLDKMQTEKIKSWSYNDDWLKVTFTDGTTENIPLVYVKIYGGCIGI